MRKRKTIEINKIVRRANAELLFKSHGNTVKYPETALAGFEAIKYMLMDFDAYEGFKYLTHTEEVEKMLLTYIEDVKAKDKYCVYNERDVKRVVEAHKAIEKTDDDKFLRKLVEQNFISLC